jgi:hypothetical protein
MNTYRPANTSNARSCMSDERGPEVADDRVNQADWRVDALAAAVTLSDRESAHRPAVRCGCRVCCGGPEAASRAGDSVSLEMKLDDLRATCGQRAGSMLLVEWHRSTWREPALAPRPAAQNMITSDARSQTGTVVPGSVGLLDPLGEFLQSEPVRH